MTLTTTHNRIEYVGNGSTVTFPYTFLILAATDLLVFHDGVDQEGAGYTVSGAGTGSGGNVTYATAPATGVEILFIRATDQTQQVNLIEGDRLPADAVEGMFDKVYAVAQDLAERMDRTVRIPPTSDFAEETIFLPDPADPANRGRALFIAADGSQLETRTILPTDIVSPITAKGDLIRGSIANAPERLAVGVDGQLLTVVAGQASWATPAASGIQATIFDAKGDLMTATAADTPVRKAVGATGSLLAADSAQADGLTWKNPQELPGAGYSTYESIADPAAPASNQIRVYNAVGRPRWRNSSQMIDAVGVPALLRFAGNPYKDVVSSSIANSIFASPPTIYAGTLGTDRGLRITLLGDILNNWAASHGFTLAFLYGATTFASVDTVGAYTQSATRRGWRAVARLEAAGATTVQIGHAELLAASGGGVSGGGAVPIALSSHNPVSFHNHVAENSGIDNVLDITIRPTAANANLSVRVFTVKVEWI